MKYVMSRGALCKRAKAVGVGPTHPGFIHSLHSSLPFLLSRSLLKSFSDNKSLGSRHKNPRLSPMANKHTIILMQTSHNRATRTFMDYDSITQAMDGLCGLYERKLKEINPAMQNITYDIADLYNFLDGLTDLSALVYDPSIHAFLPNDRQWVKQKMFQHLKRLASRSG